MRLTIRNSNRINVFLCLTFLSFSACLSNKKINYLQNLNKLSEIKIDEYVPFNFENPYLLKKDDILEISFEVENEELTKFFEFSSKRNFTSSQPITDRVGDPFFYSGYAIDHRGFIELPKIGEIHLAGLTENGAKILIQEKINQYFKEEILVKVKLGGVQFTTIGEFNDPGFKILIKNKVTIFEALAVAGDAKIIADKKNMYLVRQYLDGSKIHVVNLNDRALLSSPFYFIHPNDVLYLMPLKRRQFGKAENLSASISTFLTLASSGFLLGFLIFNRGND
jgi:polysaccharide biosynthesis/export protein